MLYSGSGGEGGPNALDLLSAAPTPQPAAATLLLEADVGFAILFRRGRRLDVVIKSALLRCVELFKRVTLFTPDVNTYPLIFYE